MCRRCHLDKLGFACPMLDEEYSLCFRCKEVRMIVICKCKREGFIRRILLRFL